MFITRSSLPRRTFLRGVGATIALPFLDAMVPALTPRLKAASAPRRAAVIYFSNGTVIEHWTPATTGKGAGYPTILKPFEPGFNDQLAFITQGVCQPAALILQQLWLEEPHGITTSEADGFFGDNLVMTAGADGGNGRQRLIERTDGNPGFAFGAKPIGVGRVVLLPRRSWGTAQKRSSTDQDFSQEIRAPSFRVELGDVRV